MFESKSPHNGHQSARDHERANKRISISKELDECERKVGEHVVAIDDEKAKIVKAKKRIAELTREKNRAEKHCRSLRATLKRHA